MSTNRFLSIITITIISTITSIITSTISTTTIIITITILPLSTQSPSQS